MQLQIPPTLRRLVNDATFRGRILRGEFAAAGAESWRCAQCDTNHPPFEDCPPLCRGCKGHHAPDRFCGAMQSLLDREREERERAEQEERRRAKVRELAAERGVSEDEAAAILAAEVVAEAERRNSEFRAKLREATARYSRKVS